VSKKTQRAEVTVRRADASDAAAVSALNARVQDLHHAILPHRFKPADSTVFPEDSVAELMALSESLFFLAERSDVPAGYVYAEIVRRAGSRHSFAFDQIYVHHICVHPDMRGVGIGGAMMDRIRATARDLPISQIALDLWSFNVPARAFFRRQGLDPFNEPMWAEFSVCLAAMGLHGVNCKA
jgi:ribosomal protein S18 acetylase RimI-like enzyme